MIEIDNSSINTKNIRKTATFWIQKSNPTSKVHLNCFIFNTL
jgi:hypothetical protein